MDKKCPCCKHKKLVIVKDPMNHRMYVVKCVNCGAIGLPSKTRDGAKRAWNEHQDEIG